MNPARRCSTLFGQLRVSSRGRQTSRTVSALTGPPCCHPGVGEGGGGIRGTGSRRNPSGAPSSATGSVHVRVSVRNLTQLDDTVPYSVRRVNISLISMSHNAVSKLMASTQRFVSRRHIFTAEIQLLTPHSGSSPLSADKVKCGFVLIFKRFKQQFDKRKVES